MTKRRSVKSLPNLFKPIDTVKLLEHLKGFRLMN
jgi:hypothetical protein